MLALGGGSANQILSHLNTTRWRSDGIGVGLQSRRASDDGRDFFNGSRRSSSGGGASISCQCWSSQKAPQGQESKNGYATAGNVPYVTWFREAWPYIQGHRGSTFVIVVPGEVVENRSNLESILQVHSRSRHLFLVDFTVLRL